MKKKRTRKNYSNKFNIVDYTFFNWFNDFYRAKLPEQFSTV